MKNTKQHSNLKPWPQGVSGNPLGKPKGSKHLSTWIKEILEDDTFTYKLANGRSKTGAPLEAMLKVLVVKALDGDTRAFDLLCKYGWGSKYDVTSNNETIGFSFNSDVQRFVKSSPDPS